MISGYLLLPRSEDLRVFYSKRIMKILIPLIVWSLLYLGWYCGSHLNTCTPNRVLDLMPPPGAYYHLWFMYSLLSIYLILPILRLMIRPDVDTKILWYLIALWLIFQPVSTTVKKFWNLDIRFSAPLTTGFVCFFFLGYLLGEIPLSRARMIFAAVVWGIASLITIIGTYLLTREAGQFDGFFYDFVSPNVILASGASFLLLRWLSDTKPFASPSTLSITRLLATGAFGVYLIHVMVMEVLRYALDVNAAMGYALWSIPLVSIIVFIVSFFLVRILQKIPAVRSIVP